MEEHSLRMAVKAEALKLVPEPVNLWPRIMARQRRHALARVVRRGVIAGLFVVVTALIASPRIQAAVLQFVGAISGPSQPTVFGPKPRFVIKQPGYLPEGFVKTWELYRPADTMLPAMRIQVQDMQIGWQPAEFVAGQVRERHSSGDAHVIFAYEAPGGGYLLLFERKAKSGEALPPGEARSVAGELASLQEGTGTATLTWVSEGTWIELEGTLPELELLVVAEGLVSVQLPSSQTSDISAFSELPFCNPRDEPLSPILGKVSGQRRNGSINIQMHDRPNHPDQVAWGSSVPNFQDGVLGPALAALRDPAYPMQPLLYQSISSFGISDNRCLVPDSGVVGYFVIEVWERQVNIGYGGSALEMRDRAIRALEHELRSEVP
jgi:hypothetical protein